MSYENWINLIKSAEKASFLSGKNRKIHYKFPNSDEMAEEYSMETGVIQRRAWKKRKQLMGDASWELELGEPIPDQDPRNQTGEELIKESNSQPSIIKRLTRKNIEWRIRNLPYPIDNYSVTADVEKKALVVRTVNKKYYKVIEIPELIRCGLAPEQSLISLHHQYNTLIITYKKPELLVEMEVETLKILKTVETETNMDDLLQGLLGK
ncbi:DPCD family protein [Megaselia abdita]